MNQLLQSMRDRWTSYDTNEQLIIGGVGALAIVVFLWLLVIQPVANWREQTARDLQRAEDSLQWLSRAAPRLRQVSLNEGPGAVSQQQSMTNIVSEAARRNNVSLTRFEQSGQNGLRFWLDDQRFDLTLAWLADLELQGIRVDQVTISQTNNPGLVTVRGVFLR
ncbi:type II secretion system protein M [Salinispirillum sp. LH 10-3-1]|uniref:Type II secretion system protein M n=1 Tax=Salinispirillum sp. LH 10-3-1 TaxID=2952525 RepID=A0AB38YB96_9GAMM